MTPAAVLVTVIAYFLVLYLVASLSGRRADNQGFFVGNRRSPWPVVAFAMIGSSISGVTFVSVPGWVQASQFSYLQMALGFVAGQLVIAFVLIPLFYRMGLVSIYQYLESRFGIASYRTGAWFFFLSKMIGAAVRVYLVCLVMQLLVFGPLHVPFVWNVAVTMVLVWLYTYRGGVKSLIWTDSLKTFCLVASVGLCIYFIASDLHLDFGDAVGADLARVGIVAGIEQPGSVLGGAHHRAHADHLLGRLAPRLGERRDHRRQRHAADIVERDALGAEQRDELHAQLVARVQLVGGHAPANAQLLVLVHAQTGLGVSHIYCQQHGAAPLVLMSPVAAFREGADFSAHQYSSRLQDGRQAHGKRPNPPAERTHRAIRTGFERRRTGAGRTLARARAPTRRPDR